MTISHPEAIRNQLCDLVVDLIDGGASAGRLEFRTSGDSEAATVFFQDPAFGAASGGTAIANTPMTDDTNATGGTVDRFAILDSNSTIILTGAVATSGSDINLSSTTIGAGDTVSLTSLSYSAPL